MNVFGLSDVGLSREQNEDTCLYELKDEGAQAIFVVCDGMGGAKSGNVASDIAANVFVEQLRQQIRSKMSARYMESILRGAVEFANYDTYRKANSADEPRNALSIHPRPGTGFCGPGHPERTEPGRRTLCAGKHPPCAG